MSATPADGETRESGPVEPDAPVRTGDDGDTGYRCDLCGGPMIERHCRIVCTVCGYQRDCSDP